MRQMRAERQYRTAQPGVAVDLRAAQEHPSVLLDAGEQAIVEGAARAMAERDDREIGRWAGVPVGHGGQAGVEIAGEADLLRLGGAEGGDAGKLQRQPEPERTKMAGQLRREIGGRRADIGRGEFLDIIGAGAERLEQFAPLTQHDGAGAVGEEQGLVRIERDAVRLLDPAKCRPPLLAQHEEAAISAIDVEPGFMFGGKRGDLAKRIDGTGIDGACRGDDQPGTDALGTVALQRLGKRVGGHPVAVVGGDRPAWRPRAPGDAQSLVDAMMGEMGDIDSAAAIRIGGLTRGDDGGEVCHAPARGQHAGGAFRHLDDPRQPVRHGIFEPHRPRGSWREARIFVARRGEEIAERGMEETAAGDVAGEAA